MADDFALVEYASHPENLLHDLVGSHAGVRYVHLAWRPLVTVSTGFDAFFFGANPWGNLLAPGLSHLLGVFAFYLLLRRLGRGGLLSGLAATLYLLHPLAQLSFPWGTARADPLAAAGMLAGLLAHLRAPPRAAPWGALPFFFLALATKETGCAFPLFAIAVDCAAGRRRRLSAYLPYVLLLGAYLGVRTAFLGTPAGGYAFIARAFAERPLATLDAALRGIARVGSFLLWGGGSRLAAAAAVAGLGLVTARIARRGAPSLRSMAGSACVLAGALGPLLPLLSPVGDITNCRPLYLLVPAVVGLLALAAGSPAILGLFCVPMLFGQTPLPAIRASERFNRELHGAVLELGRRAREGPPLVIDLPREEVLVPYRMFWGLDRLHAPPFAPSFRRIVLSCPLLPWGRSFDAGRWPVLRGLRVGAVGEPPDRVLAVLGDASPPTPQRVADLALPITARLLEAVGRGEVSPGIPVGSPPGTETRVLFLTGYGAAELPVRVDAAGKVPLREILAAPCGHPGAPVPFFHLLVVNLDMERSPLFYVALPAPDEGLVELEFDRGALSFLSSLPRG